MNYQNDNIKVLERAFSNAVVNKDRRILEIMSEALSEAVDFALELHEQDLTHKEHLKIGDSYGWMIVKDGTVMKYEVTSSDKNYGDASDMLLSFASSLPKDCWVGVVMAQMGFNNGGVLDYIFEYAVLEDTKYFTKDEFKSKFKQIFK